MSNEILKNTGYIHAELSQKDWILGASTQIPYQNRNTTHNWLQFLPVGIKQKGNVTDVMACVSFAYGDDADAQIALLQFSKLIRSEDWQKLIDLGFVVNGKFMCSRRAIAIMSKTTQSGNTFGNVYEAVRLGGLLPEADLPSDPQNLSWDEYYTPLTQDQLNKAKEILKIFSFPYHYISPLIGSEIEKALQMAPVQIATAVCAGWNSGDVLACNQPSQHSTTIYDIEDATKKYLIIDSYEPFLKKLASDYGIWSAIQSVVTPVNSVQDLSQQVSNTNLFTKDIIVGQTGNDVLKLRRALSKIGWNSQGKLINDVLNPVYDINLQTVVFSWQKANLPRGLEMVGSSLFWETVINLKGKRFGPASRACMNSLYNLWK